MDRYLPPAGRSDPRSLSNRRAEGEIKLLSALSRPRSSSQATAPVAEKLNTEQAEEAARVLYNRMPGNAWKAFRKMVNKLSTEEPYANV